MNNQKILLISGSGFLGSALLYTLKNYFPISYTQRTHTSNSITLDLEKAIAPQITNELKNGKYSYGIICAAITNVEECYHYPEKSQHVNINATSALLALFKEYKIKPIFFSSDLIFDNYKGNYKEEDPPNPTTIYGKQKFTIERKIQEIFDDYLIFRTSKLMSMDLHPRNILTSLILNARNNIESKVFVDQYISPVFIEDISQIVFYAIKNVLTGIYHLAGEEVMNRYELAQYVCKKMNIQNPNLKPIAIKELYFREPKGPINTLSSDKIKTVLGFKFTGLEQGLKHILENFY